jgi:hypothetical protein
VFVRIAAVLMLCATPLLGDLIDFENAADYGGDNAVIADNYFEQYGVSVSAMAGSSASDAREAVLAFEKSGNNDANAGYWSSRTGRDEAFSGDLGDYFLKAGTGDLSYNDSTYFVLTVDYNVATQAASGEVWDIDGPEQYTVTAFDSNGNLVASLVSPTGGLNAEPWTWSFDMGDKGDISQITVAASGEKNLRGFAFDNFNATEASPNADTHATPLPSAFALGLFGLVGMVGRDRRRRRLQSFQEAD